MAPVPHQHDFLPEASKRSLFIHNSTDSKEQSPNRSDFKTKLFTDVHLSQIIQSKFPKEWKTYLILFQILLFIKKQKNHSMKTPYVHAV